VSWSCKISSSKMQRFMSYRDHRDKKTLDDNNSVGRLRSSMLVPPKRSSRRLVHPPCTGSSLSRLNTCVTYRVISQAVGTFASELSWSQSFSRLSRNRKKILSFDFNLWPMTLKFYGFWAVFKVHVFAKFHPAKCSGSWVIVITEKKKLWTKIILSVATADSKK